MLEQIRCRSDTMASGQGCRQSVKPVRVHQIAGTSQMAETNAIFVSPNETAMFSYS